MFQILSSLIAVSILLSCSSNSGQNNNNFVRDDSKNIEFPKAGLMASLKFPSPPKKNVKTSFILKFWDSKTGNAETGPFINPSNYDLTREPTDPNNERAIYLWMPDHGHGSDPVTITKKEDNGVSFEVTKVRFTMTGKWEIKIELRNENDAVDETGVYVHEQL
jgi:hypothetical protein